MTHRPTGFRLFALAVALAAGAAAAQVAPAPAEAPATPPAAESPLGDLAWLAGCWRGTVNQREFREHWMPLRGNLMLGTGHTVAGGRTQDYEFIRLEPRADGVHYVASPVGQREAAFRLAERTTDGPDTIWTFANPAHDFPQRILYWRDGESLCAAVEGPMNGETVSERWCWRPASLR